MLTKTHKFYIHARQMLAHGGDSYDTTYTHEEHGCTHASRKTLQEELRVYEGGEIADGGFCILHRRHAPNIFDEQIPGLVSEHEES